MSWADFAAGKILDELASLGLEDSTMVVMHSDHGCECRCAATCHDVPSVCVFVSESGSFVWLRGFSGHPGEHARSGRIANRRLVALPL